MQKFVGYLCNWNLLLVIFVTFVITVGCAGQVEEKQEDTETEVIKPPPPPKSLAPGTAIVEARLMNFNKIDDHFECMIVVDKVLRYGSSTKPIGKGTELNLHISKVQSDVIKLLSEGTLEQNYEFIVEQQEVVNIPSGTSMWKALKVSKGQSDQ